MPDRLTELFANKPTSYLGAGIIYNGDTRGNGVSSSELDVQVIPRFNGGGDAAAFKGSWYPSSGGSVTSLNVTGGFIADGTTIHTIAATVLTVHAISLNYIYLVCGLNKTTVDSWVSGGVITSPTIASYTSVQQSDNTTGYIPLFTWQAGALVDRDAYFSFGCELLQKRSGSIGDVTFNWWSL